MVSQDNPSSEPRRARGRPRDWSDKTAQNTIKSLDRAMEVFEFLSEHQGKALTTLATETDQSPATVYRILVTSKGAGWWNLTPSNSFGTSARAPLSSVRGSCAAPAWSNAPAR